MRNAAVAMTVGLSALVGLWVPCGAADREADRREILRAYESIRAAHFSHDAAAFLAGYDTSWYSVTGGDIALRQKPAAQRTLQEYLDSVTFTEIVDLDPPQVEVSSDGMMAWLLGHVHVRGVQHAAHGAQSPLDFDAAWIDVWQKKDGEWRIVARANTQKDHTSPR
jgi:hypothetical protein